MYAIDCLQKNREYATRELEEQVTYCTHPQGEQSELENVTIAWIDLKKVNDIVLQIWIIDCLKIYKISDRIINSITEWKMELTTGGKTLAEMKIQRGTFQEDALSLFLFDATKPHT